MPVETGRYTVATGRVVMKHFKADGTFEIDAESNALVDTLISARSAARAAKNWAEADRIRDELTAMGIQLMDAKDPETGDIVTTWEVRR